MMELLLVDADGTFLEHDGTVRPSADQALRKAQAAGMKVLLATGRLKPELAGPLGTYPFDGYILGAGASLEYEGQLLYEKVMDGPRKQRLAEFLEAHPIPCVWEANEGSFASFATKRVLDKVAADPVHAPAMKNIMAYMKVSEDVVRGSLVKISFLENDYGFEFVKESLQDAFDIVQATFAPFGRGGGEIMMKGLSKGTAVQCLRDTLGECHVVAIGDGANDIEMFEQADFSCCMGNGCPAAKKSADVIAPAQDENGIAWIIDQLLG